MPIGGEYVPNNFEFEHSGTTQMFTEIETEILVQGIVFDETLNLELHFSKRFNDTISAQKYFISTAEKYPKSQISLVEKSIKETQVWA